MMIKSIDEKTIHQLCSSQVVIDLATSVKELVENALDANATIIEIRLRNYGADSIEVHDNGNGIQPTDFEHLAVKHTTSKLKTFEDLQNGNVLSFGFRGEALNALCELSGKFTVITRHCHHQTSQTSPSLVGSRLEFDHLGHLIKQSPIARERGTTVIVDNLFQALPVRRAEFLRSLKKHYQKVLRVIQAYALIAVGVQLSLSLISSSGAKQVVFATHRSERLEENVSALFGSSFLSTLQPFTFSFNSSSSSPAACTTEEVTVTETSMNASMNSYDDDTEACTKLLQSSSSSSSYCPAVAVVEGGGGGGGVEVTVSGFVSKAGQGVGRSDNDRQFVFCNSRPVDLPRVVRCLNEVWRRYEMKHKPAFIVCIAMHSSAVDANLSPDKREVVLQEEEALLEALQGHIDALYQPSRSMIPLSSSSSSPLPSQTTLASFVTPSPRQPQQEEHDLDEKESLVVSDSDVNVMVMEEDKGGKNGLGLGIAERRERTDLPATGTDKGRRYWSREVAVVDDVVSERQEDVDNKQTTRRGMITRPMTLAWDLSSVIDQHQKYAISMATKKRTSNKKSMDNNRNVKMRGVSGKREEQSEEEQQEKEKDKEEERYRTLQKQDFLDMRILGQFNLGFIIAELRGDLYILDQHACDEKYRFEMLQTNTKIHQQPMLVPLAIEASVAQEEVVLSHLDLFTQQGFNLRCDDDAPPGRRLKLLSVPFSKEQTFGVEDVLELASMVADGLGERGLLLRNSNASTALRLPKLLALYASRACRSAVMIGKALREAEMVRIVRQLEGLDQPWNCPHGRPTLRHLADLSHFLPSSSCTDTA